MKKILKGIMLLSVGLMLTGCGNKNNDDSGVIETPVVNETQFVDLSTDKVELYNEAVKSVVRVEVSISSSSTNLGTGVVYKKEGGYAYILTNAHVLSDSNGNKYENIHVVFHDYSKAKGTYIGVDRERDIAVFSVKDTESCTVAKIVAKDTDVVIGESVFAIGNPQGEYFSMTDGIISNNRLKTSTTYISKNGSSEVHVYNSTATINSGNSGGPLFNSKGEVVSINSMHPSSDSYRNFNYSIPINYFIKVANSLVKNMQYKEATINIEVASICDYSVDQLTSMGVKVKSGVYITSSSESGLFTGRVITQLNGRYIATKADYLFELLKYNVGDTITLVTTDNVGANEKSVSVVLK